MSAKLLGGKVTVSVQPFFWLMAVLLGASLGRGSAGEIAEGVAAKRGQSVDIKLARDVRATLTRRRDGLPATEDRNGTTVWRIA